MTKPFDCNFWLLLFIVGGGWVGVGSGWVVDDGDDDDDDDDDSSS
jgi:hypothetical protein